MRARCGSTAQPYRAARSDDRAPRRRGDDLPGAVARAATCRSPRTSCSASSRRGSGSFERAAMREIAAARSRELGRPRHLTRSAGRRAVGRRAAARRDRPRVAVGCRVLVLDEPTSSLGRRDVERLFALIRGCKANGHAIVYISHFLEEVREVCDRFTVLRDGRVAGGGPPTTDAGEIVRADGRPRRRRSLSAHAADAGESHSRRRRLASPASATLHAAPRRDPRHRRPRRRRPHRTPAGVLRARSDAVRARARRRVRRTAIAAQRWRQGVGMVSEDRKDEGLALRPAIAENITLPRLEGLGPGPLVLPGGRQRAAAARGSSGSPSSAVAAAGGRRPLRRQPAEGGASPGCCTTTSTCCCSTSRRAASTSARRRRSTRSSTRWPPATQRHGRAPRAVLMVSSYLPELLGLCDRIAVMCRGRLGPAGRSPSGTSTASCWRPPAPSAA